MCAECVFVCVCAWIWQQGQHKKSLIMADVFQRAKLSCLMWKTFTWFFVLRLKTWPQLCPLHCAAVCPKPKETPFSLLILLNCGSYKGCKSYFLSGYYNLYFFPPTLAKTLTDMHFCNKEVKVVSIWLYFVRFLERKATQKLTGWHDCKVHLS